MTAPTVMPSEAHGRGTEFPTASVVLAVQTLVVASPSFNAVTADALVAGLPQMSQVLGTGPDGRFLVQMILVAPSVSILLAAPLAGVIARYLPLRALMLACILIYCITGMAGFFSSDSLVLIVSRLLLGTASGMLGALTIALAIEFQPTMRARLLGFAGGMAAVSAMTGYILGGYLTRAFDWQSANLLYLWPLLLIPAVVKGLGAVEKTATSSQMSVSGGFPLRATLPYYLLTILIFIIIYAPAIEAPFLLATRGMNDPAHIGIAISAPAAMCAIFSTSYGFFSRHVRPPMQFCAVFAFLSASTLSVALAQGPALAVAGLAITGAGAGLYSPLLMSTLMHKVDRAHVQMVAGLFATATFISVFIAPPAYRLIADVTLLQPFGGLAILALLCLAGSIIALWRSYPNA